VGWTSNNRWSDREAIEARYARFCHSARVARTRLLQPVAQLDRSKPRLDALWFHLLR